MIHTTLDNFFLDDEALENSPSRRSGIDRDTENTLRYYGCELIQEAGILLGFQQVVMATGQVLFHRFYCKRSMKEYNVKKLAATALWQGAKLEEAPEVSGHPRELLNKIMVAVDRCIARRETAEGRKMPILDLHSKESEEFRRSLIRYEIEMLKAFGFITHVEHPHKLLLNYLQIIGLDVGMDRDEAEFPGFVQEAWNIANDSLRTTLCVRFKSSIIACGIIFYVAHKLKVPLPESPPWYEIFQVKLSQIYDICAALHQLYNTPKAQFIPVCHQILPSKPPTPATAGATASAAVDGATPTPMLGVRPGAKPLDPSVRVPVGDGSVPAGGTPGQANGANSTPAAGGVSSSTPAAAGSGAAASNPPSAAPSPQQAPGSAQKRKEHSSSRSPALDEARKRQRPDSAPQLQQQQQQSGAAEQGREETKRPLSRGGMRSRSRSRSRSCDRAKGPRQSSRRSRSRSRDRGHYKDSSRGGGGGGRGDGRYDRERDRRDRDRHGDRERSHPHSKSREHGDRDRDRDRDRHRDRRDGDRRDGRRDGHDRDRDRKEGADRGPSSKGREPDRKEQDRPQEKQQQQPGAAGFPPPPPLPGSGSNGVTSPRDSGAADSSRQQQSEQHGSGGAAKPARPASAAGDKPISPAAAAPPRPKPVAVRKKSAQQQEPAAADKSPPAGAADAAGS